jgi:hypothetical protein
MHNRTVIALNCSVIGLRRRVLLAGSALTSAFVLLMAANPQSAQAACTVSGATTVTCAGATTTTNTTHPTNPGFDRGYDFPTPLTGNVTSGATISGFGLGFQTTLGAPITVINSGTINQTLLPSVQGTAALQRVPVIVDHSLHA